MLYCDQFRFVGCDRIQYWELTRKLPKHVPYSHIGIYWVVLKMTKSEGAYLPMSSCTATVLVVSLVGKVQMWTLWVRLICYCVYLNWLRQICVLECCRPAGHSCKIHLNDRHNWEDSREMLLYCRSSKIHQIFGRRWCTILGYASCS